MSMVVSAFRDRFIVNQSLDLTTDQYTYTVDESKDQTVAFFLGVKVGWGLKG
jgi:hypothetical protein